MEESAFPRGWMMPRGGTSGVMMPEQRTSWAWTGLMAAVVALATVGGSLAQNPPPRGKAAARIGRDGANNQAGALPARRGMPNAADPLANPLVKDSLRGTYHSKFKLTAYD